MKPPKKIKSADEPTRSELEILQVLWEFGPCTARFVNDHLNEQKREVIYMSTLKLMQIMLEKGMLSKDESQRSHIYQAVVEEKKTKGKLLNNVVENLFGGSPGALMMQLLGNKKLNASELAEFEMLMKKLDEK